MRTVDSGIVAAEVAAARRDTHTLTAKNELLRFAAFTTQTNADLDTGIPQTYLQYTNGLDEDVMLAAYRFTNGKAYYTGNIAPATAGSWALTGTSNQLSGAGAGTEYAVMRYGMLANTTDPYLYVATHVGVAGSGVQLKRSVISTFSPANVGSAFGPAAVDTADQVTRVEAICPTSAGVIVAIGTHRFDLGFSTIEFYRVTATAQTRLQNIIQMPLTETASEWYDVAEYAAFICAVEDADGAIHIYANAHADGKTVQFMYREGLESIITPVVPVEPEYGNASFRASSVSKIGSLYYLCGRMTYRWNDGTTTAFDCYLTSNDAEHWSIGERSYFIQSGDSAGTMIVIEGAPDTLYYGGNLIVSVAELTPAQGYNTADADHVLDLSSRATGWTLQQTANAAQRFTVDLQNADGALVSEALVQGGARLYLESGQDGTEAAIGTYDVDAPDVVVTNKGYGTLRVTARDAANKALLRYDAPVDVDYRGMDSISTDLTDTTGLIIKTRAEDVLVLGSADGGDIADYDHVFGEDGLKSKALNNPLVAYADVANAPNGVMHATVTFPDTGSDYALGVFAFVVNGTEYQFSGFAVAKDNDFLAKAKPRAFVSDLPAYDYDTHTGGFVFTKRAQQLWTLLDEGAGTYITDDTFEATKAVAYDFACRIHGGRIQFFKKSRNYAPASATSNAQYTLVSDYQMPTSERWLRDAVARCGFALNADVWSSTTAYSAAAVGDMTLQLTAARELNFAIGDHTVQIATGTAATHPDISKQITSVTFTTGMYAWMNVGMSVRCVNGGRDGLYKVTAFTANTITVDGDVWISSPQSPSTTIYIPSAQAIYAEASSGYKKLATSGATAYLEPGTIKQEMPVKGRAAFVSEDGTAIAMRAVSTDGITHSLYSGSPGGTRGWDTTNPMATPSVWRMILHHAHLFDGLGSALNLPNDGHVIVDQEAIRYTPITSRQRSSATETVWTGIPVYYAPITVYQSNSGGIISVKNWYNGSVYVGDGFAGIVNPAGLLIEFISLENDADRRVPDIHRYVSAVGTDSGAGYAAFAPPFDATLTSPSTGNTSDMAVISGRAQMGTRKAKHANDAPVAFYPSPIGGSAITSMVTVRNYSAAMGRYRSVEDALRYLCGLAGVRGVTFRNYMTGAANKAAHTMQVSSTPTALPLVSDVADFVLDLGVYLPNSKYVLVDFRDYYRLRITLDGSTSMFISLDTTSTDIDANVFGIRAFEIVSIPLTVESEVCATSDDTCPLRIICVDNLISVEAFGSPLWTFDLNLFTHTDGTSYKRTTAAPIKLSHTDGLNLYDATVRVPELWMPTPNITLAQGENVMDAIRRICDKHHIRYRATQTGGIEFSQFIVRDEVDAASKAWKEHGRSSDDGVVVPHVQVSGLQSGAYLDAAYIAEHGYAFGAVRRDDAASVQDAALGAQLEVREATERATTDTLTGRARVAHEVEDILPLSYVPPTLDGSTETVWVNAGLPWVPNYEVVTEGTIVNPTLTETDFVISSLNWKCVNGMLYAEYLLREYKVIT